MGSGVYIILWRKFTVGHLALVYEVTTLAYSRPYVVGLAMISCNSIPVLMSISSVISVNNVLTWIAFVSHLAYME